MQDLFLDIAIKISHHVGEVKDFGANEMDEEDIDEDTMSQAIAEVIAEEGLGDGDILGGNYSTGYGGYPGESPDQPIVPGKK